MNAASQARVNERFGRPIVEGGLYLFTPPQPVLYKILSVRPVLDPGAQPGLVRIRIQAEQELIAVSHVPVEMLTLVGMPNVAPAGQFAEPQQPGQPEPQGPQGDTHGGTSGMGPDEPSRPGGPGGNGAA